MDARFPPAVRVRLGREYRQAFEQGLRLRSQHFSLHLRPHDGGFCRLGMAVSRKVSPLAVQRNRIKRMIRESFRLHRRQFPIADCVIVAKPGAAAVTPSALREDLMRLWSKLLALPLSVADGTIHAGPAVPAAAFPSPESISRPEPSGIDGPDRA